MLILNGWDLIAMPAAPSAPATMEYTAQDAVAVSVSPFSGQQQVQDWQASFLEASVSMPALTHGQAQEWIAFLLALRGQAKVFQLGDPLAVSPRGSALGVPLVDGAGQAGYNWDCCGLSFEIRRYSLGTVRDDTQYLYSFTLAGVGSPGSLRRAARIF